MAMTLQRPKPQGKAIPQIFLDTGVLKASSDTRLMFVPQDQTVTWGTEEVTRPVYRPMYWNQNTSYLRTKPARFVDTVLLRFIAALAKQGKIRLVMHHEVQWELMGVKHAYGSGALFYKAPIAFVEGPVETSGILLDGSGRDYQYEHLCSIDHARFSQLQRWTGAWQGPNNPLNRNQLLDAFHIWCAEHSNSDYFLTHDDGLIREMSKGSERRTPVNIITPTDLSHALIRHYPWQAWTFLKVIFQARFGRRDLRAEYQDAFEDFWTGRHR